jgi:hypothetical protein
MPAALDDEDDEASVPAPVGVVGVEASGTEGEIAQVARNDQ